MVTQTSFLSQTLKPVDPGNKLLCCTLLSGEKHMTSMPPRPFKTYLHIISLTVFSLQPPGKVWCSQGLSFERDWCSDSTLIPTSSGFWTSQCVSPGPFFSYWCEGDNSSMCSLGMPTIIHATLPAKFEKCCHVYEVPPTSVFFLLPHLYVPFQILPLVFTSRVSE